MIDQNSVSISALFTGNNHDLSLNPDHFRLQAHLEPLKLCTTIPRFSVNVVSRVDGRGPTVTGDCAV